VGQRTLAANAVSPGPESSSELVIGQYMMLGRIMATAQIDLSPAQGHVRARRVFGL